MSHETLLQNYPPLFAELVPGVQLVKRRAMMNRTIVSEELKKRREAWVGLHNELHATRPKPRSFSLCCYFRAVFLFCAIWPRLELALFLSALSLQTSQSTFFKCINTNM